MEPETTGDHVSSATRILYALRNGGLAVNYGYRGIYNQYSQDKDIAAAMDHNLIMQGENGRYIGTKKYFESIRNFERIMGD